MDSIYPSRCFAANPAHMSWTPRNHIIWVFITALEMVISTYPRLIVLLVVTQMHRVWIAVRLIFAVIFGSTQREKVSEKWKKVLETRNLFGHLPTSPTKAATI